STSSPRAMPSSSRWTRATATPPFAATAASSSSSISADGMEPAGEDSAPAYQHRLTLRIRHPTLDPAEITAAFGLVPESVHRVGDARTSPSGAPLKGRWKDTYWSVGLGHGDAHENDLPTALAGVLEMLGPRLAFFERLRAEGGQAEFFIGWFMTRSMAG